jgi:hypothetical protein
MVTGRYRNDMQLLKEAMDNTKVVELLSEGNRVLEPYILYESSTGKILLGCYQLSGYSKRGKLPAWRTIKSNEIRNVNLTEKDFTIRSEFRPSNKKIYTKIIHMAKKKDIF